VPDTNFTDGLSARALDTIDTVVATVNDKAVRPVVVAARGVVFGVVITVVGLSVAVLACVAFLRLTVAYTIPFDHKVWISYLVLGALFSLVGAFLYAKRGVTPDA
jgi:hypothetical protein